jgi:hypothetical protein
MTDVKVPLIIRGELIEDYTLEFGSRTGGTRFVTPDVKKYLNRLLCDHPISQLDLYAISLADIIEFIGEVGRRLNLDTNPYWREAFEVSCRASNVSRSVLESVYRTCPATLRPEYAHDFVNSRIGAAYLEGWVPTTLIDGRRIEVRAMGARGVHIIAGNVPVVAIATLLRCLVTRSDSIIKLPSNDLLTMVALVRTMIDIDPHHPLTKHISVAYWKGGDETVESAIFQPRYIEKIVAWGGFASVKHITRYLQPGLDLITLDPKSSTTLLGREALADDATMQTVAERVAADMAGWDQEACANARVMYLESGTDAAGIAAANRFGEALYQAIQRLPPTISAGPVQFDPALKVEIEGILSQRDFYRIYCDWKNIERTGAVIVSQFGEQVDFPKLLYGRVGNLVPVDNIEEALDRFTASTQTVGVYPDTLRVKLRDRGALMGGQMFMPIGYAITGSICGPIDGLEAERRMCRWVVDTHCNPERVPGPWMHPEEIARILESTRQAA